MRNCSRKAASAFPLVNYLPVAPVHEPRCQLVNHVALVQLDSVDTEPMGACNEECRLNGGTGWSEIREKGIGPESHHEAAGPGLAASPWACRFLGRRPGENMRCQVFNRPHDRLAAPRSVRIRAISTSTIPHTMKGSPESDVISREGLSGAANRTPADYGSACGPLRLLMGSTVGRTPKRCGRDLFLGTC
jgi:hypothetical protein